MSRPKGSCPNLEAEGGTTGASPASAVTWYGGWKGELEICLVRPVFWTGIKKKQRISLYGNEEGKRLIKIDL